MATKKHWKKSPTDHRVQKLLRQLSDRQWHLDPPKGVGPMTVGFCHDQGLIKLRQAERKKRGDVEYHRLAFAITRPGLNALETL